MVGCDVNVFMMLSWVYRNGSFELVIGGGIFYISLVRSSGVDLR